MDGNEIAELFKDKLDEDVISISDRTKGYDQEVKIIQTKNDRFVLKTPHYEKDKILKEIVGIKYCAEKNIPVPEVLYSDENTLIETCLEGKDLDGIEASEDTFEHIFLELGRLMSSMHSIQATGYGDVNNEDLIGRFSNQQDAIEPNFYNDLEQLKETGHYSNESLEKIKQFYERNKHFLQTEESVFLHSDIYDPNIVVNNGKISGIIDFGDLSAGPAMKDFALLYINHHDDYKFTKVLEGYGEHSMEEIRFYAFLWLCWKTAFKITRQEFDARFLRQKKLFENIWS